MRRILIAIGTTLTGLILLFSWPTSLNKAAGAPLGAGDMNGVSAEAAPASPAPAAAAPAAKPAAPAPAAAAPAAKPAAPAPAPAAPAKPTTFDGATTSTSFGPVQVEITVTAGKVSKAAAIQAPSSGRSTQISGYAVPLLNESAVKAQSAKISMVSGATYTSSGYAKSLQSALDKAGL